MRKISMIAMAVLMFMGSGVMAQKAKTYIPWENGKLQVSDEGRYLRHENGTPFFWLGETGWLMPERLNRDEVNYYLQKCKEAGYNMVQVQVLNSVPSYNIYGKSSNPDGWNFKNIDKKGEYGYWDHMDYIIRTAASKGIYIGMVCIWGSPVDAGLMNEKEAVAYGEYLVNRYKDDPNIIWIIGGDIRGDKKTEVWDALARSIRQQDKDHLMTFHPRGRTTSAAWFNVCLRTIFMEKVLILTGGTLRTLIRKASMAIGTTWIISLGRQLRKVSISVWYVFGEALWMPD